MKNSSAPGEFFSSLEEKVIGFLSKAYVLKLVNPKFSITVEESSATPNGLDFKKFRFIYIHC